MRYLPARHEAARAPPPRRRVRHAPRAIRPGRPGRARPAVRHRSRCRGRTGGSGARPRRRATAAARPARPSGGGPGDRGSAPRSRRGGMTPRSRGTARARARAWSCPRRMVRARAPARPGRSPGRRPRGPPAPPSPSSAARIGGRRRPWRRTPSQLDRRGRMPRRRRRRSAGGTGMPGGTSPGTAPATRSALARARRSALHASGIAPATSAIASGTRHSTAKVGPSMRPDASSGAEARGSPLRRTRRRRPSRQMRRLSRPLVRASPSPVVRRWRRCDGGRPRRRRTRRVPRATGRVRRSPPAVRREAAPVGVPRGSRRAALHEQGRPDADDEAGEHCPARFGGEERDTHDGDHEDDRGTHDRLHDPQRDVLQFVDVIDEAREEIATSARGESVGGDRQEALEDSSPNRRELPGGTASCPVSRSR